MVPQHLRDAILGADPNPCPGSLGPAAYAFEERWRADREERAARSRRLVG